jgi:hypothetical protein
MSDISNSELRKRILAIDTTYRIDQNTTKEFLLPEFYLDRLVDFIAAEVTTALINELELQNSHYSNKTGHLLLYERDGKNIYIADRINELQQGGNTQL